MDIEAAVAALGALAQETRLGIFRRLVIAGAGGLPAGALARSLAIAPPNLSFHLRQLEAAGLVGSRRAGRQVIYSLEIDGMRSLMSFLIEDCCQGAPELCAPVQSPRPCCPPAAAPARKRKAPTAG